MSIPRLRINLQDFLQIARCTTRIIFRERRPPQAVSCRDRPGFKSEGFGEVRLRGVREPGRQIQIAHPHQRGHIVGAQLEGAPEEGPRVVDLPLGAVQMAEIVRPAEIARVERLRVEETGLGRVRVLRRHQELAHLAVGVAQISDRRRSRPDRP